jgi:hypothetical protein
MTQKEFIILIKNPENIGNQHLSDLKEMIEQFPYFAPARILYLKLLQQSNSLHFPVNLKSAAIYCSSRRWLYYYLYPEKLTSKEPYRPERIGKSAGDYFDMLDVVENAGGNAKQTLKNLAERLKLARVMVVETGSKTSTINTQIIEDEKIIKPEVNLPLEIKPEIRPIQSDYFLTEELVISEQNVKELVSKKKYSDAIVILKQLNLNNPKKSVYFADQIRFLEKVIANSKK